MSHEEFYENRRTGRKTYKYSEAMRWVQSGDTVYHWYRDGSCGLIKRL